jgi:hypothetical protein
MLVEHAHIARAAAPERGGKGAGLDHVAAQIDRAEQARIAREAAVAAHILQCQIDALSLPSGCAPVRCHGFVLVGVEFHLARVNPLKCLQIRLRISVVGPRPARSAIRVSTPSTHQAARLAAADPISTVSSGESSSLTPIRAASATPAGPPKTSPQATADDGARRRFAGAARHHVGKRDQRAADSAGDARPALMVRAPCSASAWLRVFGGQFGFTN